MDEINDTSELFAQGNEFSQEVNNILIDQFNGDVTDPGWLDYCTQMDAWVAAT